MEQLDNQVVCSACGERYNLEEIPAYAALELEKEELAKKVRELGKKGKDYDFLTDYLSTTTLGKLVMQISALEAENAALRKRLEPIEEWWERNCSEYIRNKHAKWDASMYEVIEQCMQMAPETDEK